MDQLSSCDAPVTAAPAKPRFDPRRVYVALVGIPLLYGILVYAPPIGLFALALATAMLGVGEVYRMYLGSRPFPPAMFVGLLGAGLILAAVQWAEWLSLQSAMLLLTFGTLAASLSAASPSDRRLTDAAVAILGALYVALCLSYALRLRALPDGVWLVCFVLLVTWAGDTGAYYVGSLFGRTPLAPRLSPKKTVEGLIGGWALALAAALLARAWFLPSLSLLDCLLTSLVLTGMGVVGDLVESALKRSAGVKDSGGLLPGHGGMMDRIDSVLFAAPAFYYYVALLKA